MSLLALFFLFPLVYMFVSNFKPDSQILQDIDSPQAFLPARRHQSRQLLRGLRASAVRTVHVQLGAHHRAHGGHRTDRELHGGLRPVSAGVEKVGFVVMAVVIATLIVPFETIAVPMVYWVAQLPTLVLEGGIACRGPDFGWLNTYQVQIVPFIANAFSIFLFTQYFSTIPKSLDEAARIDGASWFGIYRRIIVPLSGPAFASRRDPHLPAGVEPVPLAADGGAEGGTSSWSWSAGIAVLLPAQHRVGRGHGLHLDDHRSGAHHVCDFQRAFVELDRGERGQGMTRDRRHNGGATSASTSDLRARARRWRVFDLPESWVWDFRAHRRSGERVPPVLPLRVARPRPTEMLGTTERGSATPSRRTCVPVDPRRGCARSRRDTPALESSSPPGRGPWCRAPRRHLVPLLHRKP